MTVTDTVTDTKQEERLDKIEDKLDLVIESIDALQRAIASQKKDIPEIINDSMNWILTKRAIQGYSRIRAGQKLDMSRKYNYYPRAIFQFLNDLAFRNNLSIKEVETVLLREQIQSLGFTCHHTNVGFSKKTNEPFCKDCWTKMKMVKPPTYNFSGKIINPPICEPLTTFLTAERERERTLERQRENERLRKDWERQGKERETCETTTQYKYTLSKKMGVIYYKL